MNALIKFKEVTKTFGGVTANDKISLRVPEGHNTGLIGTNGSGRPTPICGLGVNTGSGGGYDSWAEPTPLDAVNAVAQPAISHRQMRFDLDFIC